GAQASVCLSQWAASVCLTLQIWDAPQAIAQQRANLQWLDPPSALTAINVNDVLKAESAMHHAQKVKAWAEYVFVGWKAHHADIARALKAYT
ncbi:MAG: hypothetical protein AAFY57_19160, partial [Cyanobacteria bacterium J06642_2]